MNKKSQILDEINNNYLEFAKLHEKFKNSDTEVFFIFLLENRNIINFLRRNYDDLFLTLKEHDKIIDYSSFWQNDSKTRKNIQHTIARKFSNYLNSIFSIVSYNRKHVEKILKLDAEIFLKYEQKKKNFLNTCHEHKFLQDLRDHSNHYSYLKIGSNIKYEREGTVKSIILYRNDLLRDKGISSGTKKFIKSSGEKIHLNNILINHYKEFLEIQNWIYLQILKVDRVRTESFIHNLTNYYFEVEKLKLENNLIFNKAYLRLIKYSYEQALRTT